MDRVELERMLDRAEASLGFCLWCGELDHYSKTDGKCFECREEPWMHGQVAYFRAWCSAWMDGNIDSRGRAIFK